LWRFYLLMVRPEKNDAAFQWSEFFERVNSDFIDNIGNLVNRTLTYLKKNFDGELRDQPLPDDYRAFVAACQTELKAVTESLEAVKLRDALRQILAVGNRGNKFFQDAAPWEQIKTDRDAAHLTVSVLAYLVRSLAIALEPFMPATAERILAMMNLTAQSWTDLGRFEGLDGHRIGKPEILYRKLDPKQVEKLRRKFSGEQPNFGHFHIKVGRITAVAKHPDAEHLYVLTVDLGNDETRTIVAGLVAHYSAEELTDRKVLVLANLPAANLRGVTSEGMVLVCQKRNSMELIDGEPFNPGATAAVADMRAENVTIDIDRFKKAPFRVVDGKVTFDEQDITVDGQPLRTHKLLNGKVR
jgi:methionyl-tRNA synthetase